MDPDPGSFGSPASPLDSRVYEIGAAALFVLWAELWVYNVDYLRWSWPRFGYDRKRVQWAVSFVTIATGEMLRLGWTIIGLLGASTKWWSVVWMKDVPWRFAPLVCLTVTACGAFCAMRVLVPDGTDQKPGGWVWPAIIVVLVAGAVGFSH